MKVLIFLATLFFLVHISTPSLISAKKETQPAKFQFKAFQLDEKIDLCGTCVDFSGQFISQLLNIVLNAGVVGGCGELCQIVADKTGSKYAGLACTLLCDIVGIREFIKIVEKADLDPIYYCELLDACPIKDDGDATIVSLTISPNAVPRGSGFDIDMTYKTINGTGTGEIALEIRTADGIPISDSHLTTPQDPGTHSVSWKAKADPDPNCDPSQGPCEMWIPGNYSAISLVCNGECGSSHPHSQIYDRKESKFTVVNQN